MTSEKAYEWAREQVKHEDGLINNRVTWLLVFHGLLFGALFQALSLFEGTKLPLASHRSALVIALSLLCAIGIASSLVAASAVSVAHAHISAVRKWWQGQLGQASELPPFMGTQGIRVLGFSLSGSTFLRALALAWSVLLFLLVWAAHQK